MGAFDTQKLHSKMNIHTWEPCFYPILYVCCCWNLSAGFLSLSLDPICLPITIPSLNLDVHFAAVFSPNYCHTNGEQNFFCFSKFLDCFLGLLYSSTKYVLGIVSNAWNTIHSGPTVKRQYYVFKVQKVPSIGSHGILRHFSLLLSILLSFMISDLPPWATLLQRDYLIP